jgi:hypothetical protein
MKLENMVPAWNAIVSVINLIEKDGHDDPIRQFTNETADKRPEKPFQCFRCQRICI